MRTPLVVPETKPVLDLLQEFQQKRRHMAIVVDEYGSTVGLVTVEDAIEQLVGEVDDEFDPVGGTLIANCKVVACNLYSIELYRASMFVRAFRGRPGVYHHFCAHGFDSSHFEIAKESEAARA